MNAFQKCRNTSDAVPLYLPQQLYLKPIAQINITVQLPKKLLGKTVSNWELMEKLRSLIAPDEFAQLKVTKSTIEYIRFEAELEDKRNIERVVSKLDNKLIKLMEFHDLFKVRALESRPNFPNKHVWDSFFRDAKDMNEMKPGERPDTIHISKLPIRWFVPYHLSGDDSLKPSEKIFERVFEKFGRIRYVDVPVCDPYRKQMKSHMSGLQTFSFDEKDFFEGYVQFKDYVGFTKTMDALRGMKLLHKDDEVDEIYTTKINVDFDRTKHMSDASMKRRQIVRDRLIRKEREKEEKEQNEKEDILKKEQDERQKELDLKSEKDRRRIEREDKRKMKILAHLKVNGTDEINDKIAKEEKKLLKAQRKLEAIRLVEELFKRIKNKQETIVAPLSKKRKEIDDELSRCKTSYEMELSSQRDKLHRAIEGRAVLKTILGGQSRSRTNSSSSDTSISLEEGNGQTKLFPMNQNWYPPFPQQNGIYPYMGALYPPMRAHSSYYPYTNNYNEYYRGRGYRGATPGPSRGNYRRPRGNFNNYRRRGRGLQCYPPEIQEEYCRYFHKLLQGSHDDREYRSYSRSKSKSRSKSRTHHRRSRSDSRSRRPYSRGRSRDKRSRSRSRSYSRSSRSRRSRSKSKSRRSRSTSRSRRSKSHKDRSRTKSTSKSRNRRSASNKSVDSSKFISPSRLRGQRSRSWSMPKESAGRNQSWSKSPSH